MLNDLALEVAGLTKTFGHTKALQGLNLTVPTGQVVGFLGPNGSGKSTTIRILLGLIRADGGRTRLLGGDPWTNAVELHKRVAYVPGEVSLWPNLTGGQCLDILATLSGSVTPARQAEMIDRFELDPTKKTRAYSKGNRQKVALIAALSSTAELLILDEPTAGLDPLMEAAFAESIHEIKAAGRSVLLSSHIFSEVERLADTVTIIRDGRTVESGTLTQLRHLTRTQVTVTLDGPATGLADIPGVYDLQEVDGRIHLAVDDDAISPVMARLATLHPRALEASQPSLEELFLSHYATETTKAGQVQ